MNKDSKTIDIKLPTRWEDLTQKQLRYVFTLIAQDYIIDEVKTFCFFCWSGIRILHRYGDDGYMCNRGKLRIVLTAAQVTAAIAALDWIKTLPATPIRLERIGRLQAIAADFQGVPFDIQNIIDVLFLFC